MKVIPNILFTISILLTIILCIIVYSITGEISNNFGFVMQGIQSFGDGDLNTRIPEINDCEFDVLAKSFNNMGDQMQTLITENYETKLRESETQIMALNLQMNPHFLYNTLNSIAKSERKHQCAKSGFTDLTGMVSCEYIRLSRTSEGLTLHLFPLRSPNRTPISE